MACCCKSGRESTKVTTSCLGRCDIPKHRCLDREEIKPGPVPRYMGWLWDAWDSPEHQLRCGWRPGHISCPVLKMIEFHNNCVRGECSPCQRSCSRSPCSRSPCSRAPCPRSPCPRSPCPRSPCNSCGVLPPRPCIKPECGTPMPCPSVTPSCTRPPCYPGQSIIRITRHGGNYSITTKPSNITNAPTGPYPLKYVLNVDPDDLMSPEKAKYSVEAKFNDYHFDYITSQTSFVLDFSPPDQKCHKPCPKRSVPCIGPLDPCA